MTVIATQSPSLTIAKSANPTTVTAAGQSVTYTFSRRKHRQRDTDRRGRHRRPDRARWRRSRRTARASSTPTGTCSGATTTLVPGQTAVFSGTYTVTQADIDHGSIVDHATATGTPPSGTAVTATSNTVTVTATQSASIVIDKTASPTTVTAAGQVITYTFMVTNTSNVTLTDVNVTDESDAAGRRRHRDLPKPL